MSAYLMTRTTPLPAMTPAETFQTLCARCHGEKGDGKGPNAIYLDPSPRDLTRAEFMVDQAASATSSPRSDDGVAWNLNAARGARTLTTRQIQGVFDYVWAAYVKEQAPPDEDPQDARYESSADVD